MCGIVGILALAPGASIDRSLLERMNASIRHRGPDSDGFYVVPDAVGLAMRRLAIIDVAGSDQPIGNEDGTVQVVFNGEIYNFADVRRELIARGHQFRTHGDTEVIVHAYEEYGDRCVEHFRGMFAFALWDANRERLLLARDRAGIKQLFYAVHHGRLVWGSELKALLADPALERRIRPAAVNHFLTFLYVPEPMTMFEGIDELPAAHLLVAEKGRVEVKPYWSLHYAEDPRMSESEAAEGLRHHLDEAVRIRLVSEVPIGAFLSGGIDSASVVALMARHSQSAVNTFSIGYATGGDAFDERSHARRIAERYHTHHREFEMRPDLVHVLPDLVQAFDQPCADSTAIPTWYLCQYTRQFVTVALSGLGGDEVAAGYERHRGVMLGEKVAWIPRWAMRGILAPLAEAIPDPKSGAQWAQRLKRFTRSASLPLEERYFEMIAQLSSEARAKLIAPAYLEQIDLDDPLRHYLAHVAAVPEASALNRALYADLKLYLPGDLLTLTDRMSMAHSLEVRVPFLDHKLLEFAARIPAHYKLRGMKLKNVLKVAVRDLLPEDFFTRRKMGFSAPIAVWFREELRPFVEETLSPEALRRVGVFRPEAVRAILDQHFERRANHDNVIWALLSFMVWHERYIAASSAPAHRANRSA
jgi:asparagine synthase (glutamine-hydrolysing)